MISGAAIAQRTGTAPELLADDHPIWIEVADTLGYLINNLLLSFAPQRIILGGGVMSKSGLIEAVRNKVAKLLAGYLPVEERAGGWETLIVAPGLKDSSGLVGGILLASRLICQP